MSGAPRRMHGEIFVKLAVGFARDPKVSALTRFGAPDANLGRDLYVNMILYCKENLTDGFVPMEEIGRLAYPLAADHAEQIAKQLASTLLIKEVSNVSDNLSANGSTNGLGPGYVVCAYVRRNGTRAQTLRLGEVRAAAGRKAAGRANDGRNLPGNLPATCDPETESETENGGTSNQLAAVSASHARTREARAELAEPPPPRAEPEPPPEPRETQTAETAKTAASDYSDSTLIKTDYQQFDAAIIAEVRRHAGREIDHETAADIRADVLRGKQPKSPISYVLGAIRDEAGKDPSLAVWLAAPVSYTEPDTEAAPRRAAKPPWCGECDKRTRMRDWNGDHPYRCIRCHPLAAERPSTPRRGHPSTRTAAEAIAAASQPPGDFDPGRGADPDRAHAGAAEARRQLAARAAAAPASAAEGARPPEPPRLHGPALAARQAAESRAARGTLPPPVTDLALPEPQAEPGGPVAEPEATEPGELNRRRLGPLPPAEADAEAAAELAEAEAQAAHDAAEAADPGYLEDAAAMDETETDDPFIGDHDDSEPWENDDPRNEYEYDDEPPF